MKKLGIKIAAAAASALMLTSVVTGGERLVPPAEAQSGIVTVNPQETDEAFKNPFIGFRPSRYVHDTSFVDHEYGSVYKQYIKYSDLETNASDTVEKIKLWSNNTWAGIEKKNIKVIPRVFIVYPDVGEYWPNDIPHDKSTPEAEAARWLTPQVKERLVSFIKKLGEAWDYDSRVAYIELGLWGNWGEHHIYPAVMADGGDRITMEFQKALGDAAKTAFKNKKVQVRYPETFQNYNYGFFWDSFGLPEDAETGEGIIAKNNWKTAVHGGEVAYNWGTRDNIGETPDDSLKVPNNTAYLNDWIRKTHTSSLGWISEYDQNDPQVAVGAAEMQKTLGYRYVINEVSFSEQTAPGGKLDVSFDVTNTGSAPMYYNWKVEAALLRADKSVAWKGKFQNTDIRQWLPGDKWNSATQSYDVQPLKNRVTGSFTLPAGLKAGTYTLALSINDIAGDVPSVRFAVENYYKGGRTPLGKVGVGQAPANQNLGAFDKLKTDQSLHYKISADRMRLK
ncbi:DUF4832 domain-containing protein [Paenibacillus pasadenensis]|uniref:DUF4832 domain-containing protein n=1 Tax=Paenibacillus pasadenensis TaxID=217090 RepID=UPI00203AD35E|nr:DUF4832 domain-containing protein [Paenibacillus pasadenensis]MCM3748657.1 DUF4832 domain-containing protein [Paenibacillus pasadenensis]